MRLIQHDYAHDPWRVLVCCILLNRTGGKQVRSVLDDFFRRWPDASSLAVENPEAVVPVIRSLGFSNKRSSTVVRFSKEYLAGFDDPRELHGIGLYGWEAYQVVCRGNTAVEPTDKVLGRYLDYVRSRTEVVHNNDVSAVVC